MEHEWIITCPKCGSHSISKKDNGYICDDCGYYAEPVDEIEKKIIESYINQCVKL